MKRITYSIDVGQGVKFSVGVDRARPRNSSLNKRYNPFEMQLDGWSESVHESIDDFDPVFEELYAKYNKSMHVSPELSSALMLGGRAFMFSEQQHVQGPRSMGQVLKNNPDLMKNMMSAAARHQQTQGGGSDERGRSVEMAGPGFDISSLMGGMVPPPPMNTSEEVRVEDADDDISDIVSAAEEDEEDERRPFQCRSLEKSDEEKAPVVAGEKG